jgi:glutamine amidotransferase
MAFVVVDYQKGNIRSVQKGLELAGVEVRVSSEARAIARADAIVLPGVGAFADAAAYLAASGQMEAIREALGRGVPFLGICLGLHLLLEYGEEGVAEVTSREVPDATWAEGIGAIRGHVRRIDSVTPDGRTLKVPHVGWNQLRLVPACDGADAAPASAAPSTSATLPAPAPVSAATAALLDGIEDGSNFYFTHSYQGVLVDEANVLATVTHATTFPCAINKGTAFGVQFHPEKSSHKGLRVLENFARFARRC